jgi:hypothetical protein
MLGDRRLAAALAVSALIHLSMVTVFNIGVWLPVQVPKYTEFGFIPLEAPGNGAPRLQAPDLDSLLQESRAENDLPDVNLPGLPSAEYERRMLQERSLRLSDELLQEEAPPASDSWARLGQEVQQWRQTLRDLSFFETNPEPPAERPVHRSLAGDGFEVLIRWLNEPDDREVLLSPPIEILWKRDSAAMERPVDVIFRVGPEGRVREVLEGSAAPDVELMLSIARTLQKYRFEPLPEGRSADQFGSLIVRPAEEDSDNRLLPPRLREPRPAPGLRLGNGGRD